MRMNFVSLNDLYLLFGISAVSRTACPNSGAINCVAGSSCPTGQVDKSLEHTCASGQICCDNSA